MSHYSETDRRAFLGLSAAAAGSLAVAGHVVLAQTVPVAQSKPEPKVDTEENVAPAEDLMREHGLLNRVLLIYEEVTRRIAIKQDVNPDALMQSAKIIRNFIEDYHEKLEEDFIFPRLEKANKLVDLTRTLRQQHEVGRKITERVISLATLKSLHDPSDSRSIVANLFAFIRMYRPHETREDTVLFPAFREVVSSQEYAALGEDFEKKEIAMFGKEGFEGMVEQVAGIEKGLGIYDLDQFTPRISSPPPKQP